MAGEIELDDVPCGILQTLDDGTIRRVNRTFAAGIGVPKAELVGRRFQDLLTVGGKIFHHTHWAPLLRMQGSISEVKLEFAHPTGPIPMVFNAIRRDDGQGGHVNDIAAYIARDRDRYEQELVRARKRLETVVAELDILHRDAKSRATFAEQMMGIVSHDLRNPLGAILMGTNLLDAHASSDPQKRVIQRVRNATNRASHLIDDLLDFTSARVGSGLSVSLAPLALHDVIADGLDELRLAHPTREIIHHRLGEKACVGDARRLVQLVGNLIGNALVYGTADTMITVTTSVFPCWITIHNEGTPISADLQARMFEPLARGHEPGSARSVGLGLFIVREIARAHGGSASVVSDEAGTTFRIDWQSK